MKLNSFIGLVIYGCMLTPDVDSKRSAAHNATAHFTPVMDITTMETEPAMVLRTPTEPTAHTESSFVVYLASLDFNNVHTSAVYVRSDKFVYNNITNTRTFSGNLMSSHQYDTLDECFQSGQMDCVPRADVVYIRFESEPDDPWAIDQIDVDVTFQLEPGSDARYTWHFEHAILLPCSSWIEERSVYQIGPRVGLFIKQNYQYTPRSGYLDGNEFPYINELELNKMHLGYVDNNNVTVTVTIRDAECFSASTASSFSVHLAAINFDSRFQSWITIPSENFRYNEETGQRHFSGSFKGNLHGAGSLDDCFEELNFDCAPRADAVFIRFNNQPEDAWAIDQIFVDTSYRLGPTEEHEQKWHFEHPILMPCSSWLDDTLTYQIGPRNGLFLTHNYRYNAETDEFIRDWA